MEFVIASLRAGHDDLDIFQTAHSLWGNGYSLRPEPLQQLFRYARKATKPILDLGSGLSTLIMGVAASVPIHALESEPSWVERNRTAFDRLGVKDVTIHHCPLIDGWYSIPDDLPDGFGLVLVDGPQGNREMVFDRLGSRIENAVVMFDDVASDDFSLGMYRWTVARSRNLVNMDRFAISQPNNRSSADIA